MGKVYFRIKVQIYDVYKVHGKWVLRKNLPGFQKVLHQNKYFLISFIYELLKHPGIKKLLKRKGKRKKESN